MIRRIILFVLSEFRCESRADIASESFTSLNIMVNAVGKKSSCIELIDTETVIAVDHGKAIFLCDCGESVGKLGQLFAADVRIAVGVGHASVIRGPIAEGGERDEYSQGGICSEQSLDAVSESTAKGRSIEPVIVIVYLDSCSRGEVVCAVVNHYRVNSAEVYLLEQGELLGEIRRTARCRRILRRPVLACDRISQSVHGEFIVARIGVD